MPSVRKIRTSKDEALIEFSAPLAGLDQMNGSPKFLAFSQSDLRTPSRVDSRIASLDFEKLGVEVFRQPDPSHPLGWVLGVRNLPRPPLTKTPKGHRSPLFLDGFETRDFAAWSATVGDAEVQSTTTIDGGFSGRFAYAGSQGQAQTTLFDSFGEAPGIGFPELFLMFRFRLADLPASTTCIGGLLRVQVKSDGLCITSDGSVVIVTGGNTEHDTGYDIAADTVYWGAVWARVNDALLHTGDIIGAVWDSSGTLQGSVIVEDVDLLVASFDGCSVGAYGGDDVETFIDSVYIRDDDWPVGGVTGNALVPIAAGTWDEWPTLEPGTGEDKWDDVEMPVDDNTWIFTGGGVGTTIQSFDHGGAVAVGGFGGSDQPDCTILFNRSKNADTIKRSNAFLSDGITKQNSKNDTHTSFEWGRPVLRETDPDGGLWSTKAIADIDALELGCNKLASSFAEAFWSSSVLQVYMVPSGLSFDDPPSLPVKVTKTQVVIV